MNVSDFFNTYNFHESLLESNTYKADAGDVHTFSFKASEVEFFDSNI